VPANSIHPIARSYDAVASKYEDTLDGKPYDCARFDVVIGSAIEGLPALDVGCGPGQAAAYLRRAGLETVGIDISPEMVLVARQNDPAVDLYMMDLRAMTFADGSFGALVARYSLIHFARETMPAVLGELARVTAPGAPLLLTFYDGDGQRDIETSDGSDAPLPATLYRRTELEGLLNDSGLFDGVRVEGRRPYRDEQEPWRIFVTAARKSG